VSAIEPLVSADDVAAMLGVTNEWVLDQARAERLHSYKLGHYRRFRLSEIEAWLQARAAGHYKRRTAMNADHAGT
jgi:excisionase family DNA binding protein